MIKLYLKTIPKALNWLGLASLFVLIIKIFSLNRIPELFRGGYELGIVFEGLLASVFASYVFYLIVVHIKEVRDKSIIYPHITKWAKYVVGDCRCQIFAFANISGEELDFASLTVDNLKLAFTKIDPHSKAPLLLGSANNYANWIQYLDYYRKRSKNYIAKIMAQLIYLDAEIVVFLTAVDDCSHFSFTETFAHIPIRNSDMSAFANEFHSYLGACRQLERYLEATKS